MVYLITLMAYLITLIRRISWAFNLAGDWHETSGLTIELNATAPQGSAQQREEQQEEEQQASADGGGAGAEEASADDDGAFGYTARRPRVHRRKPPRIDDNPRHKSDTRQPCERTIEDEHATRHTPVRVRVRVGWGADD